MRAVTQGKKPQRNKRKIKFKREIEGAPEEKMQRSIENQYFLFFSYFLSIHGDVFDA